MKGYGWLSKSTEPFSYATAGTYQAQLELSLDDGDVITSPPSP